MEVRGFSIAFNFWVFIITYVFSNVNVCSIFISLLLHPSCRLLLQASRPEFFSLRT